MRLSRISRSCFAWTFANQRRNRHITTTARFMMASDKLISTPLIDVDCNLLHRDMKSLQTSKDIGNEWMILEEDAIQSANICAMLSPSSTIDEAKRGLNLLKTVPPPLPVRTTVGIHPYHVNDEEMKEQTLQSCEEQIKALVGSHTDVCAAIGECGLDASEGFPPIQDQIPWFEMQVKIAEELQLPLFVHERLAFTEAIEILKDVNVPVIIHCFTGTKEQCVEYIQRGFYISISGYILRESNENYEEVASCLKDGVIPLEKLMIETDAPYMGFAGCRDLYIQHNTEYVNSLNSKKRKRLQQSIYPNVPSSLLAVLDQVVKFLQESNSAVTRDQVAKQTTANARAFFGF